MKRFILSLIIISFGMMVSCCHSNVTTMEKTDSHQTLKSEAKILRSWQGDFPVNQLERLPEVQGVGYIGDTQTFGAVWAAFKPGEEVPKIDFNNELVLFVRNTQFYNRVSIGRVNVTDGVAEVLAMETMSARPIEDKVAMSLAVIPRLGVRGVRSGNQIISVQPGTTGQN